MKEPSLWDAVAGIADIAIARMSDPATSHEAAAEVTKSGSRQRQLTAVLAAVSGNPGATSAEIAKASNLDRYLVARRLPELEKLGFVRRGEAKICTASPKPGLRAITWTATSQGDQR